MNACNLKVYVNETLGPVLPLHEMIPQRVISSLTTISLTGDMDT